MNDLEADFIRAIQRDPEDDEARLIYADWLEQQGDVRSEYLRLEVQRRRIPRRLAELAQIVSPSWRAEVDLRCRVLLISTDNMLKTLMAIREATQLGLKEAIELESEARTTGYAVICDDIDPDVARSIAATFEGAATVKVEAYVGEPPPRRPRPAAVPHSLVLVSIHVDRRIEALALVRELTGWGLAEASRVIDEIAAGTPHEIRVVIDPADVATVVARFRDIAEVRAGGALP
jgi:uncharacterized protein (TIGR02996 family)